ncbi:phosphoribosyltransferase [Candidatus Woesearchaeota archaeon]|nr:phosphoribosyltransferase [Candidatus Woesearchaeota archaeon]
MCYAKYKLLSEASTRVEVKAGSSTKFIFASQDYTYGVFNDRIESGKQLAAKLSKYKGKKDVLVLGIPRGGVEVAYAISMELGTKLGVAVAKKIPFPGNSELAVGAVAFGGVVSLEDSFVFSQGTGKDYIDSEVKRLAAEIKRRYLAYNADFPDVKNKIAVVVDDGMATGHTVLAAVRAVKKGKPKKIIVAVPVSSRQAAEMVRAECDELVCLDTPDYFMAVGEFYRNFPQLSDDDVVDYIKKCKSIGL